MEKLIIIVDRSRLNNSEPPNSEEQMWEHGFKVQAPNSFFLQLEFKHKIYFKECW